MFNWVYQLDWLKTQNIKQLTLTLYEYSAFVGPSLGGFLLEQIGYRQGTLVILIIDIVLVK